MVDRDFILTDDEKRVIRALRRLEKIWPDSLWIYVASGSMCLMRKTDDGDRADVCGGVDDSYRITSFESIPCDGGDW